MSEIPGHELFVSDVHLDGCTARIRLVSDYLPIEDRLGRAYEITFRIEASALELKAFLMQCMAEDAAIYLAIDGGVLSIATEYGEDYSSPIGLLKTAELELNERELRKGLSQLYHWYTQESNALRTCQSRVSSAQNLLVDSLTRIERKSQGHAPTSTAGVLYAQQASTLSRLLQILSGGGQS